jgi:hypothetical protein
VTLREEHRLRVFENKVLKRIFGPRRDLKSVTVQIFWENSNKSKFYTGGN